MIVVICFSAFFEAEQQKVQHFHNVADVQYISEFIENATIEKS